MHFKKRKTIKIYSGQDKGTQIRQKQYQHFHRWNPVFYDYRQDLYAIFSFQNISSSKLFNISYRLYLLPLYFFCLGTLYQHERSFVYHFHYHLYDRACIGADLPDEV
jgi:hypothetical protein